MRLLLSFGEKRLPAANGASKVVWHVEKRCAAVTSTRIESRTSAGGILPGVEKEEDPKVTLGEEISTGKSQQDIRKEMENRYGQAEIGEVGR